VPLRCEIRKPNEAVAKDFDRWILSGDSKRYPDMDLWIEDIQMQAFLEEVIEMRSEEALKDEQDPF